MKYYKLTLAMALMLIWPFFGWSQGKKYKEPKAHQLTEEWQLYDEAHQKDLPQTELDVLSEIMEKAKAGNLVWDFYDAAVAYRDVTIRRDWKMHDKASRQLDSVVAAWDNALISSWHLLQGGNSRFMSYIKEHKKYLSEGHDAFIAERAADSNEFGITGKNDFENLLLQAMQFSGMRSEAASLFKSEYIGVYPQEACIEYMLISSADRQAQLEAFAKKYEGKAVSLFARKDLLSREFYDLSKYGRYSPSQDYLTLREKCVDFQKSRKTFRGTEKTLAMKCDVSHIIKNLDSRDIDASIKDRQLTVALRNLVSVKVSIVSKTDKKSVWKTVLRNSKNSYYVKDTLKAEIPLLPDGEYELKLSSKKERFQAEYKRHSLSLATQNTSQGIEIYAADYITGKPVDKLDVHVRYANGHKEVFRGFALDGFTPLKVSMAWYINGDKKYEARSIMVCYVDKDGLLKSSEELDLGYDIPLIHKNRNAGGRVSGVLLTDCGVYSPGETLHVKAILYNDCELVRDTESHVLANQAISLELRDADRKVVGKKELTTNEFGSATASFELPEEGKHGRFEIVMSHNGLYTSYKDVIVEEYVLPTYNVSIDRSQPDWFPGDMVTLRGQAKAYSGRSMGDVKATYTISRYGSRYSGESETNDLDIAGDGSFEISFVADELKNPDSSIWYDISIKLQDATGEVKEAHANCRVSDRPDVSVEILDAEESSFEVTESELQERYLPKCMILGDRIHLRVESGQVPGNADSSYKLYDHKGTLLSEGSLPVGNDAFIVLPSAKAALYRLDVTVAKADQAGKIHMSRISSHSVMVAPEAEENVVPEGVESFFRIIDGDSLFGVQFGTENAPVWAIVEVWDNEKNILLREKKTLTTDLNAAVLTYPFLESYPEAVALSVFYFRNGSEHQWHHVYKNSVSRTSVPLEFSRFTDTTGPGTTIQFAVKTQADSECAVAVFDKSTESYMANYWNALPLSRQPLPYADIQAECGYDMTVQEITGRPYYGGMKMAKATMSAVAMDSAPRMMESNEVMTEESVESASADEMAVSEEFDAVEIRSDMRNILAFEPFVRSDKDGVASFSVTTSDKLSTFIVNVLAHDKNAYSAAIRGEFMVTMPIQLSLAQAQFLYEGDAYMLDASLSNDGEADLKGDVLFSFSDGDKVVLKKTVKVSVPAHDASPLAVMLNKVPACESGNLGIKVAFLGTDASGLKLSDAVYVEVPVREASQIVEEAHSAVLTAGADKAKLVASLRSQFKNVSASSIKQREITIADMIQEVMEGECEPRSEDAISLMAAITVRHLTGKGQTDALVAKLLDCRNVDGGFGWRAGMPSSAAVTAYILESAAQFRDRDHELDAALERVIEDAVAYLDACEFTGKKLPVWRGGISIEQYTYVRSFYTDVAFAQKVDKDAKKAMRDYFSLDNALQGALIAKVRRLVTLDKLLASDSKLASEWGLQRDKKLQERIRGDIESLAQYAVAHKSGGEYFPNAVMPYRGLFESEAYAHSMICNALAPYRPALADDIRLWLMVQKETQKWPTDPACVNAVLSILDGSASLLETKVLVLEGQAKLPFSKIARTGNGMSVVQSWSVLRDGAWLQGVDFNSGEKVRVTYNLWSEENRSFVRFKAPLPACLQPVDKLSGYRWSCYRDLKAGEIEYWYQSFPEENTTVTEEFYAVRPGTFQSAAPSIVSTYASHYSAIDKVDIIFVSQTQ